jgi:hypothetical protein
MWTRKFQSHVPPQQYGCCGGGLILYLFSSPAVCSIVKLTEQENFCLLRTALSKRITNFVWLWFVEIEFLSSRSFAAAFYLYHNGYGCCGYFGWKRITTLFRIGGVDCWGGREHNRIESLISLLSFYQCYAAHCLLSLFPISKLKNYTIKEDHWMTRQPKIIKNIFHFRLINKTLIYWKNVRPSGGMPSGL